MLAGQGLDSTVRCQQKLLLATVQETHQVIQDQAARITTQQAIIQVPSGAGRGVDLDSTVRCQQKLLLATVQETHQVIQDQAARITTQQDIIQVPSGAREGSVRVGCSLGGEGMSVGRGSVNRSYC